MSSQAPMKDVYGLKSCVAARLAGAPHCSAVPTQQTANLRDYKPGELREQEGFALTSALALLLRRSLSNAMSHMMKSTLSKVQFP